MIHKKHVAKVLEMDGAEVKRYHQNPVEKEATDLFVDHSNLDKRWKIEKPQEEPSSHEIERAANAVGMGIEELKLFAKELKE